MAKLALAESSVSGPVLLDAMTALSDRAHDVITRLIVPGLDPRTTPIAQVMSPNPFTVEPTLTLDKAMALISEKRMRHLPVVADGRLVGLVSIGDLNKWLVEHLRFEAATLRSYVSDQYPG